MDDDQFTRQRAMDAAAAVAVAAAAAAHQNQEAAALRQQQKRERQDSDSDHKHGVNGMQNLDQDVVDTVNGYTQDTAHDAQLAVEAVENVRKLHESDETFADNSMQYVASDMHSQNGDTSHIDESQSTMNRPTVHHTKRRKVNTCLPCKRRKVKCDREKPYCGQCKKHNFPASECTWSAAVLGPSPVRRRNSEVSGIAAVADAAAAAVSSATASGSGSQWYEMGGAPWANFTPLPIDQSSQALASRVAELEAANAALAATRENDLNGDARHNTEQWDVKGAVLSEAERGMAADALAMIAHHDPQANLSISSDYTVGEPISYKGKRLLPSTSSAIPSEVLLYQQHAGSTRIREIAALLPDMATTRQLVADLSMVQEYGLDPGINIKLITNQLDTLEDIVEKAVHEDSIVLDLSFIALLFFVLAFTMEMKDSCEVSPNISLPELHANDISMKMRVTELWSGAGQALLGLLEYEDGYNLNILLALSLKHHYLNARGKVMAARNALAEALSICDTVHALESNSDQIGDNSYFPILEAQLRSLRLESAQTIYRSLVAQYCLQEEYPLVSCTFDFQTAKAKGKANFSNAMFDMARDFGEAKHSRSDLQALEEKWSRLDALLGPGDHGLSTIEAVVKRHGQAVGFQWTVLQMLAGHQIVRLLRKRSQEPSVTSAHRLLRRRRWLEEQTPTVFRAAKVPVLQQVTLEAAFFVALRLVKTSAEGVATPDARGELINAIRYLSSKEEGQSTAQKMLQHLLDHTDGKDPAQNSLQDDDPIFKYLVGACSGANSEGAEEVRFWKAIAGQGTRLLESSNHL